MKPNPQITKHIDFNHLTNLTICEAALAELDTYEGRARRMPRATPEDIIDKAYALEAIQLRKLIVNMKAVDISTGSVIYGVILRNILNALRARYPTAYDQVIADVTPTHPNIQWLASNL
jgi:hypothetical protein